MKPKVDPDYLSSTTGVIGLVDNKPYIICKGCNAAVPTAYNGPVHNIAVCEAYHEGYRDGQTAALEEVKSNEKVYCQSCKHFIYDCICQSQSQ